ncbi:Transcription factor [Mycena indigotica]|uniref:Transcription factor n=1 Tax=Mycena indigotica TaxID=2126181 RepID=A0A8H6SK43_9AGAR|nr:Transcription factor [Mycena indigotica]KAF7301093.1 Transcription factor [Mycena indigotica]
MPAENEMHASEFTPEDDQHLAKFLATHERGRTGQRLYDRLVENPDKWPWAARHSRVSWKARYRERRQELDELIGKYLRSKSKAVAASSNAKASSSKRPPRVWFTQEDEEHFAHYLAEHCPTNQGRHAKKLYEQLCENTDNQWPWAQRHPQRSWYHLYLRRQERFNERISEIQLTKRGKRVMEVYIESRTDDAKIKKATPRLLLAEEEEESGSDTKQTLKPEDPQAPTASLPLVEVLQESQSTDASQSQDSMEVDQLLSDDENSNNSSKIISGSLHPVCLEEPDSETRSSKTISTKPPIRPDRSPLDQLRWMSPEKDEMDDSVCSDQTSSHQSAPNGPIKPTSEVKADILVSSIFTIKCSQQENAIASSSKLTLSRFTPASATANQKRDFPITSQPDSGSASSRTADLRPESIAPLSRSSVPIIGVSALGERTNQTPSSFLTLTAPEWHESSSTSSRPAGTETNDASLSSRLEGGKDSASARPQELNISTPSEQPEFDWQEFLFSEKTQQNVDVLLDPTTMSPPRPRPDRHAQVAVYEPTPLFFKEKGRRTRVRRDRRREIENRRPS